MPASEVVGRADHYRQLLERNWGQAREPLLLARTEDEFSRAWGQVPSYVQREFVPDLFPFLLKIRRDPKFPKKESKQIAFFAESLAGLGVESPRRSREICAEERKKVVHHIKRRDYYIECSCGYEGPAIYGACPACGTKDNSWPT